MDIEILCDLLGSLPFFNAAPEFQLGVDCIDKTPCCANKIVVLLPQFQEFRPRSPRDRYPVVGPTYEGQDDCFFVPVNYAQEFSDQIRYTFIICSTIFDERLALGQW